MRNPQLPKAGPTQQSCNQCCPQKKLTDSDAKKAKTLLTTISDKQLTCFLKQARPTNKRVLKNVITVFSVLFIAYFADAPWDSAPP